MSRAGGQPEQIVNGASAFHVSRDGKNLALWRRTESNDGFTLTPYGSPRLPRREPEEYKHGPSVRTPFTPVYLRFSPDGKLLYLSMYTDAGAEMWLLPFPAGSGKPRRIFEKVPWNRPRSRVLDAR